MFCCLTGLKRIPRRIGCLLRGFRLGATRRGIHFYAPRGNEEYSELLLQRGFYQPLLLSILDNGWQIQGGIGKSKHKVLGYTYSICGFKGNGYRLADVGINCACNPAILGAAGYDSLNGQVAAA